jgi:integrase
MSIYQPKGSKTWTMDFHFDGQRIRESCGTRSETLAKKIESKRRHNLEEAREGFKKKKKHALLFSLAAEKYLEKQTTWAPKTRSIAENAKAHLLPTFAGRLLLDIEPDDIRRYQKKRTAEGAAPRTINIETGFLRSVMGSAWARLQDDDDDKVSLLEEPASIGRKLSPDEETILLRECNHSRSRVLFPLVVLAIETGARKNVIRTLLWKWIDFANACIQFGKDKTASGTGRIIPLNQRALEVLKMWATQFPSREGEHYVFPAEKYGAAGDVFEATAYATDPTRPIASIKEAWESAKKRAGVKCRFHDLKHTAVSRMLDAGVPMAKVAKIVGWSDSTMVSMSARYGHFTVDDLRSAVETMTAQAGTSEIDGGYPRFSPQSDTKDGCHRAN